MEEEFDIISMAPDLHAVYGNLTKRLREKKDYMLYNLLANQVDTYFDKEQILVFAKDQTAYDMLQKHKRKLPPEIEIQPPKKNAIKNPKTEYLRKIFGEKLSVKGRI
ncbi:MAG: hypothetical protein FWE31_00470 [Firmicutes bacterium]|nr:hypothetical protein [Bacillota bacterium]